MVALFPNRLPASGNELLGGDARAARNHGLHLLVAERRGTDIGVIWQGCSLALGNFCFSMEQVR
jgi:hypothetical protein